MRQLLPVPVERFDPSTLLDRHDRPATARPWLMANMVASIDGAYSVDGRSGALSGEEDRALFHALRAAADAVLVAAGTARTERYRRPRIEDTALRERRRAKGWQAAPRLALVSTSLELPEDLPLLGGAGPTPLVLHPEGASTADVPAGVELLALPRTASGGVDPDAILGALGRDGHEVVLCEGGPTLLGQLHAADLLDELFVTTSTWLVGGEHVGLLGTTPAAPRPWRLHRLLEAGGNLFATYRRDRTAT
jgi:5-amino-6-(5-phosphoribosylamino)uracil reductase